LSVFALVLLFRSALAYHSEEFDQAAGVAMADKFKQINEAFGLFLTPFLSKDAREIIRARFGDEVAVDVEAIYDDALNPPVDWRIATIDTALPVLRDLLNRKYPWLNAKARSNLIGAFVMDRK
jgi:hypothetical protein